MIPDGNACWTSARLARPCVFDPQGVLFEHQTGLVDVRSCSTKTGVELGPLLFAGLKKSPPLRPCVVPFPVIPLHTSLSSVVSAASSSMKFYVVDDRSLHRSRSSGARCRSRVSTRLGSWNSNARTKVLFRPQNSVSRSRRGSSHEFPWSWYLEHSKPKLFGRAAKDEGPSIYIYKYI